MNVNAFFRISFVLMLSSASLSTATDKPVRVDASRDLRLAVVDASRPSKASDAQYAAFADSLGEAVSKQCGSTIGVKFKRVSADNAAFNLGTGVYDAVLVVSSAIPRPLMIAEVSRQSAILGAGKSEKKLYFLFGTSDAALASLLAASFSVALDNQKFLDTLNDPDGHAAPAGQKLASAGP